MNKLPEVALGIVTSVGGFLEIGSLATAAQGGALFGYQLLWVVVLGGACLAFLIEQSGRLAAVSGQPVPAAIRDRFGFGYYFTMLVVIVLVTLLVLAANIGGVCIALEFATGIDYRWWALPVAFTTWLLLWKGKFSLIEQGLSFLGLVTLCFVVAAYKLEPQWGDVASGMLPSLPAQDAGRYWYIAVSILGASLTPYLMFFYSSGAVEDKWDKSFLGANRAIAGVGIVFGSVISMSVLVVAALVLLPRGIEVEHYWELRSLLQYVFGRWGLALIIASLAVACIAAALEITLAVAYMVAQGLGWNWSEDPRPRKEARFCCVYTIVIVLGGLIALCGPDPLKLTNISMVLTAATLPLAIVPFLFIMNDPCFVENHANGRLSNAVVVFTIALAFVLAIVSIPLQIMGSG